MFGTGTQVRGGRRRGRVEERRAASWGVAVAAGVAVLALTGCGSDEPRTSTGGVAGTATAPPVSGGSGQGGAGFAARVTPDSSSKPPVETPKRVVTYEEAESVFRTGDYGEAAHLFEAYAERMPTNPWGHYMLGISAWRAGDHARSELALRRTVEVDPDHEKGLLNLSRVLLEQRKASDALDFVKKVVEIDSELGEGWRVLGNVHAELRMTEDAIEAYRKAILIDPTDSWTINNLGLLYIQMGRYRDALPPLARATELRPDVATFQNNFAVALERTGYARQAAERYRAALAADEGHAKSRESLTRVEAMVPFSPEIDFDAEGMAAVFEADVAGWKAGAGATAEIPTAAPSGTPVGGSDDGPTGSGLDEGF